MQILLLFIWLSNIVGVMITTVTVIIQSQISVGRMVFKLNLQRGAQDRSFIPVKIPIHRVLNGRSAPEMFWRDANEGAEF